jgi:hypothetical protein
LILAVAAGCAGQRAATVAAGSPLQPGPAAGVTAPAAPAMATLPTSGLTAAPATPTPSASAPAALPGVAAVQTAQVQAVLAVTAEAAAAASLAEANATVQAQAASLAATNATVQAQAVSLAAANATVQARASAVAAAPATIQALAGAAAVTPTVAPQVVGTPVPVPTLTPGPTAAAAACVPVDPALADVAGSAQTAGLSLGCTIAAPAPVSGNGALQVFWTDPTNPDPAARRLSLMIWLGDSREVDVVQGQDHNASQGALMRYPDTWQPDDPPVSPACAAMVPLAGFVMPVRGFGKVWCADDLAAVVGWPNQQETAASLLLQPARDGLLMKVSAPDQGRGYAIALDYGLARAFAIPVAP